MDAKPPIGWVLELTGPDPVRAATSYRQSAQRLHRERHSLSAEELTVQVDGLLLRIDRALLHNPSGDVRRHLLVSAELLLRASATAHRRQLRLIDAWITAGAARRVRRLHLSV